MNLTLSLLQSLRNCRDNNQLKSLSSWFSLFPSTSPVFQVRPMPFPIKLNLSSEFYQPQCKTVIKDIHRCYRSIRHELWRQFSQIERRQLRYWVQTHPGLMHEPMTTTISRQQATYLFWRMVWEGRTRPISLFQQSLAPYTGLWVWRLVNLFEERDEDNRKIPTSVSKELEAFHEALNDTYTLCDHLAGRMMAKNQICFDPNWIEIPSNILPSSPFFKTTPRVSVK